uniref:Peptidase C1A papain C-terminal domain-containing protein n=1 Tax=Panagrolaimus superbus TaxID=310955 RepID=A0A914Y076_9BILA
MSKEMAKVYDNKAMVPPVCNDFIKCANVPVSQVDWTITSMKIKDQGNHNICYAVAFIDAMEISAYYDCEKIVRLSIEQLLDCSTAQGNRGLDGGCFSCSIAYGYEKSISNISYYPEDRDTRKCRRELIEPIYRVKDVLTINGKEKLLQCLSVAPVSAAIYVTQEFKDYLGGILSYGCPKGAKLNHYVNIIGFKIIGGKRVYLIRNTWGEAWGLGGYA